MVDDEMREHPSQDNRIENVEKAQAMALAEDQYQIMITNARKNGFEEIAQELEGTSEQKATEAAKKFDAADKAAVEELKRIADWVKKDL